MALPAASRAEEVIGPTPTMGGSPGLHASTGMLGRSRPDVGCSGYGKEVRWVREVWKEERGDEMGRRCRDGGWWSTIMRCGRAGQKRDAHVQLRAYRGAIVYKQQVEIAKMKSTNLDILVAVG
jgi:hypothetical protein